MKQKKPNNIKMDAVLEDINSSDNITPVPVDPTAVFGPQRDSLYLVIPITIIYIIIFVTGIFGNIFTCIIIFRNKNMHTATNLYLFSLAISDLLLLVSGMPQELYSIWWKWPYVFGNTFCVLRALAAESSTNASVLTITLFTIERHLAICHPFVSHRMSKLSRATKHVFILWIISFGLALPIALQFGIRKPRGVPMCLQTRVIIAHSFEISTFVFFLAPMVLITILYTLIGFKLRETSMCNDQTQKDLQKSQSHLNKHKLKRKHSQSTRRVIKMLVAVVIAFFVCWAPFHAQRLVAIYGTTDNHQAKSPMLLTVYYFLTYMSGVFYYMSTCINPIFYHIMSNKFRDAFKSTIKPWCCQQPTASNRCSYTAMAIVRNPTSSNSGNSMKNEPNINFNKKRRYSSRTKRCECSTQVLGTLPAENQIFKHSKDTVEEPQVTPIEEITVNFVNNDNHKQQCSNQPLSTGLNEKNESIIKNNEVDDVSDDYKKSEKSDNYIKEVKLEIDKQVKEYG